MEGRTFDDSVSGIFWKSQILHSRSKLLPKKLVITSSKLYRRLGENILVSDNIPFSGNHRCRGIRCCRGIENHSPIWREKALSIAYYLLDRDRTESSLFQTLARGMVFSLKSRGKLMRFPSEIHDQIKEKDDHYINCEKRSCCAPNHMRDFAFWAIRNSLSRRIEISLLILCHRLLL